MEISLGRVRTEIWGVKAACNCAGESLAAGSTGAWDDSEAGFALQQLLVLPQHDVFCAAQQPEASGTGAAVPCVRSNATPNRMDKTSFTVFTIAYTSECAKSFIVFSCHLLALQSFPMNERGSGFVQTQV